MTELSIIFPCYNEADRLPQLFDALENFKLTEVKLHYIFVDDCSSDESPSLIQDWLIKNESNISAKLIIKEINAGKGPAVVSGDAAAETNLRCFLDVDLSTPLECLGRAVDLSTKTNPDLVIGSRHCPGANLVLAQGPLRLALGRAFSFFTSVFHQSAFSDTQCGFKLWTKKFSESIVQKSETSRWSFDIAWIMQAEEKNYLIEELPVSWTNDERSKVSAVRDGILMARDVLRYRMIFGSRLVLGFSIAMFFVGLFMAMRSSNDMQIYLNKAWIPLANGITEIYEPLRKSQGGYYYSPLFALLGVPFSIFSTTLTKMLYYVLYVVMALCGWVYLKRLIRYTGFKFKSHTMIPTLFLIALMNNHFGQSLSGNVSAQVAALMMASGYFYFIGMRKTSAVLLALAINFKVYPAFLLLFFFLKRDFKFLLSCMVASVFCLALPAFFVGWNSNIQMHLDQIAALKAYGAQNDFGRVAFQSLTAASVRIARVFIVDEALVMRVIQFSGVAAVVAYWSYLKKYHQESKREFLVWIFSMLILGLIAPASWVHHFGFVYAPAILFVLGHIFSRDLGMRLSAPQVSLFYLFLVLYSFTTEGVVGNSFNNTLEQLNVPTVGLVALLASFLISVKAELRRIA